MASGIRAQRGISDGVAGGSPPRGPTTTGPDHQGFFKHPPKAHLSKDTLLHTTLIRMTPLWTEIETASLCLALEHHSHSATKCGSLAYLQMTAKSKQPCDEQALLHSVSLPSLQKAYYHNTLQYQRNLNDPSNHPENLNSASYFQKKP